MCGNEGVGTSPRSPAIRGTNESSSVQSQLVRGPGKGELGSCQSSQDAGREPAMPAAGPLSPGSALQKRLLVTGRERRQPRAHALPPPPGHTHTPGPAAAAYLPRRPASFLCGAQAAAAASDAPLTRPRPARRSRSELGASNPLARRPRRDRRFLQLRSSCSRLLSVSPQLQRRVPAPPPARPRAPRPRARANQRARLRPSPLAPRPPPLPLTVPAREPCGRRGGAPALRTLPAAGLAFRPRQRGCPGPPGRALPPRWSALPLRPPAAYAAAGVSGTRGGGVGRGGGRVQTQRPRL